MHSQLKLFSLQAVNENSLKKLNEYVNGLTSRRRLSPTSLIFYVRDTKGIDTEQRGAISS